MRSNCQDRKIIYKGIVVFLLIVIVGIVVAETQLNDLTKRADYVQCFNVRRNVDSYAFFLFGTSHQIRAIKNIGNFVNTEDEIRYQIDGEQVIIPTRITVDIHDVLLQATNIRQHILMEIKQQKKGLILYLQQLGNYLQEVTTKITLWRQEVKKNLLKM